MYGYGFTNAQERPRRRGRLGRAVLPPLLAGARRGGGGLPRARRRDGGGDGRRLSGAIAAIPGTFLAAVVVVAFLAAGIYGVAFGAVGGAVGASLAAYFDRGREIERGTDDDRTAADARRADGPR